MLRKKGKDFAYCYNKACGYQEKREPQEKAEASYESDSEANEA